MGKGPCDWPTHWSLSILEGIPGFCSFPKYGLQCTESKLGQCETRLYLNFPLWGRSLVSDLQVLQFQCFTLLENYEIHTRTIFLCQQNFGIRKVKICIEILILNQTFVLIFKDIFPACLCLSTLILPPTLLTLKSLCIISNIFLPYIHPSYLGKIKNMEQNASFYRFLKYCFPKALEF